MKATEIQIGDWVKLMNPKGEWIDNVKIDMNLFNIFLRDGEEGFIRFEPIPLTSEILEKNGGVKDYNDYNGYIVGNSIGLWVVDDGFEFGHITVRYVHDFQHLLRLCGLNELADNFKV